LRVSHRPLALVSALTLGDYLLWNWSLGANHEIAALVSGLTLPPLAIAFAWLTVLSVARLIAHSRLRPRTSVHRDLEALRNPPEHMQPAPSSFDAHAAAGDQATARQPKASDKLAA
jgi:hypothetical protein